MGFRCWGMKSNRGFSLVELIGSLTIVGVAAATATPALLSLESAAKDSKVDGAIAAVQSGINVTHARWIMNGSPKGRSSLYLEEEMIGVQDGWPAADSIALVAGISCDNYGCIINGDSVTFTATNAPAEGEACFIYRKSSGNRRYFLSERLVWDSGYRRCG